MKRYLPILATVILAALVYWLVVPGHPPAPSSTDSAANRTATVNADAPKAAPSAPDASSDIDTASDTTEPDLSQPVTSPEPPALETARAAAVLSRTPKGIWANRAPSIEDYISDIPAKHALALADFRAQFPEFDPTDVKHFTKALMRQRDEYGDTLEESESKRMNAWLEPMRDMQKEAVIARATLVGVALRGSEPIDTEGTSRSFMLAGFDGIDPRYVYTANAAAAESTGANLVRFTPTYDERINSPADGTGLYININDVGTIIQHPEFQLPNNGGSRVIYKDDYPPHEHPTHVAGTVGAWGYDANLMGMAPRVWFRSFAGDFFVTGVRSHGMMWPGQKHDSNNPRTGQPEMKSAASSASIVMYKGGSYTDESSWQDAVLNDYPYLTYFLAAGNEGGAYKTVSGDANSCKNGVTIGSVNDTARDDSGNYVSGGDIAQDSSRGPTVDGRIKPDLTANGVGLTSPVSATKTGNRSGTSMATPNASGSAMLLIDYITRKLPGHFFRSSTIKALLVNTATDRGNAGPDYTYGYGIVNVKAAADIVKRYAENSSTRVLVEDTLSSSETWTQTYTYDGNGPIRLSLAWIDPSGAANGTSPTLVNDLNVRLIDSGGSTYQPFVMPFTTGKGSFAAYDANLYDDTAVTGNNFTDNVEQILVATPPPGTYTVQVTHSGLLKNNANQRFSLAITGLSGSTPITPVLTSISPTYHNGSSPNKFAITLDGSGFLLGSDVLLRRAAANGAMQEAKSYSIIPVANRIIARFDLATLSPGYWDVVVRTPDGTESTLPDAFLIPPPKPRVTLYSNNFESGAADLTLGSNWAVADPNKGGVSGPADAQEGANALVTYPGGNYAYTWDGTSIFRTAYLPSIDTRGYTDVKLEFQRWLGLATGDWAQVKDHNYNIITDQYLESYTTRLIDTGWTAQSYSRDQFANRSSLIFSFQLYADSTDHSFGWNIDDLKITAVSTSAPTVYPPRFSSTALTSATQGQAYSYSVTTSDSDTAGASRVLAATGLPTGLTFTPDGSGGATLSGTPSVHGVFSVSISVSDGSYTTYQSFSLAVTPSGGNTAPVITTSSLPNAYQGEAYSTNITATDANAHSLSFFLTSPVPAWLSLTNHGNGIATLSGTPIIGALSSYLIDVSASDGFVTTTQALTLVVEPRTTIGFSAATDTVNEAAGTVTLTVNRTVNSTGPVSLSYASANGSANAADYTAVTGNLSWADGDLTSRTIVVPILQDTSSEVKETFTVTLSSLTGIATFGTSVATVTIVDDDPVLVTVAVTDRACAENNSDNGTFTLTRTGPASSSLTVNYSLSGTATNGTDYAQLNDTVNFAANSSTVDVAIDPVNDTAYEGGESVILTINSGTDYTPDSTASATISITDNDKPTVSVAAAASSVGEDVGTTTLTFTRNGNNAIGPLTVNFAVSGTATSGSDYQSIGTSVVIPQFQPSATVTVTILNDSSIETAETLIVTIPTNAAYNVATAPGNAKTITILDDETFASWITSQLGVGALAAATDDPDGDGFDNLLEYALGTAAGNSSSVPPVGSSLTTSLKLTFTPARITGLTYIVESSPDLSDWTATNVTSLLTAGQPYEFTDPNPLTNHRFLRLKVTSP